MSLCKWCIKEAKIPYINPEYCSMDHRTLHQSFRDRFETIKRIEAQKPKADLQEFQRIEDSLMKPAIKQ